MRQLPTVLVAIALQLTAALAQAPGRGSSGSMLFGSLLIDHELQKELKLSEAQIKRMREIYIQSQPPSKIIFSTWGIRELGISQSQLKVVGTMQRDHLQKVLKLQKNAAQSLGGRDFRLLMEKRRQMETSLDQEKLKVLTRSQWKRFEDLRGKPYQPFGKLPGKPKSKPEV